MAKKISEVADGFRNSNKKKGSNKGILSRRINERAARSQERQAARDLRTNEEQLRLIATRPGTSAKEVARLS